MDCQTDLSYCEVTPGEEAEMHMYSVDFKELAEARRRSLEEKERELDELKTSFLNVTSENDELKAELNTTKEENKILVTRVEVMGEMLVETQELVELLKPVVQDGEEEEQTENAEREAAENEENAS